MMKRRDFLTRALQFSAAGLIVPPALRGTTALAKGGTNPLAQGGIDHTLGGKILVLVHLEGGNDGLNTVIPYTDPAYQTLRPSIAIPGDQVLPIAAGVGLHPALLPLHELFEDGKVAVLHGVGYPDMNQSHFRATDIWMSGSSENVYLESGWLARFIEAMFPGFPSTLPPHPYGIQQALHDRIPMQGNRGRTGIVVDSPESFFSLVLGSYSGDWGDQLPSTRGGKELHFVRRLDRETFEYAEAIGDAADAGTNTVEYPETSFGRQMEVIARLVSGGLGTPLYVGSQGGFDTHSEQLDRHDEILGKLADGISAFMRDLANQGMEDRVVVLTISEFGRRPEENGGWGTDHGSSAPAFAVGGKIAGGVYGTMPSLTELDPYSNFLVTQDYRGIYARLLTDHFDAPIEVAHEVLQGSYSCPAFLQDSGGGTRRISPSGPTLRAPYPNPASASRTGRVLVQYDLGRESHVEVDVFDPAGRRVRHLAGGVQSQGSHQVGWDLDQLAAGSYLIRMRTPDWKEERKVIVLP